MMTESKPNLCINKAQVTCNNGTLGMSRYLRAYIDSGEFNITYHNEFIRSSRGNRATILYYNKKKIYLDFWEYPTPTYSNNVIDGDFDLIIKLQHRKMTVDHYLNFLRRKNIFSSKTDEELESFYNKIVPYSFFPSKLMFPYEGKAKLPSFKITQDAFFCGKGWRCRKNFKKDFKRQGIEYIVSEQDVQKEITDDIFLEKMLRSKYGLAIQGRSVAITDSKNRREIDYMILKKPLLLTYRPYYYNDLIPGHHYIFYDGKTKVKDLEKKYDLKTIAENGYQWYLANATKEALPKVFKQITKEKLGV